VQSRVPGAQITFDVDPAAAISLARNLTIDDAVARAEWGWEPAFGLDAMIDDFLADL
jgi:nucleoside-diphosphate-sugar epimerase